MSFVTLTKKIAAAAEKVLEYNMEKTYPIEFKRFTEYQFKTVEWMLSNVCNFSCSFCPDEIKSGSKRWLDLETYKNTCQVLIQQADNKKVWFKFTGGEPTLYPKLIELLSFIKSTGNYTYILSNGARTLRWWEELKEANCLDKLNLTYHPEQTDDIYHIIKIAELFKSTNTEISVCVTCIPNLFEKSVKAFEILKEQCVANLSLLQINDRFNMEKYSEEQRQVLLKNTSINNTVHTAKKTQNYHNSQMILVYNNKSSKRDHVLQFIKRDQNNFLNWECDAGKDLIRINHTEISRAVCGVGDKWSIFDEKLFQETSVVCTKNNCWCAMDMMQPKRKITNA